MNLMEMEQSTVQIGIIKLKYHQVEIGTMEEQHYTNELTNSFVENGVLKL